MAVARVQSNSSFGASFATDGIAELSFGVAATVGNRAYVFFGVGGSSRSVTSVTDDGGNTYALVTDGAQAATVESVGSNECWCYAANVGTAATQITITLSSAYAGADASIVIVEVSGQAAASPDEDVAVGTTVAATSHTVGNVTLAAADGMLLSYMYGSTGAYTLDADFTSIVNASQHVAGYDQLAASGTYDCTNTSPGSESLLMMLIAVKAETAGGSVTKTPAQAVLTVNVLAPTTNAFTYVAIQDTLINESGQAVANAANIRLMVWYNGEAIGAPDYSANGQTSNASGSISWSVTPGTLANGQAIFYVAQDSISYSNYTCGRVVPTYG